MKGLGVQLVGEHLPSTCKALIWFPAIEEGGAAAASKTGFPALGDRGAAGGLAGALTGPTSTFLPVGGLKWSILSDSHIKITED